ncbi:unnamed protein product [Rotaria sp. Silwood2]|nr:unnamed protein product [Rotaria sp. Silwood2]
MATNATSETISSPYDKSVAIRIMKRESPHQNNGVDAYSRAITPTSIIRIPSPKPQHQQHQQQRQQRQQRRQRRQRQQARQHQQRQQRQQRRQHRQRQHQQRQHQQRQHQRRQQQPRRQQVGLSLIALLLALDLSDFFHSIISSRREQKYRQGV